MQLTTITLLHDCDPDKNLPFDKCLKKIEIPQQMAEEYVLRAIANIVRKPLIVYNCQSAPRVYYPVSRPVNNSDCKSVEVMNIENCVSLLYSDGTSTNAGHYKALVKNMDCNASSKTVPEQNLVNLLPEN